MIEGPFCGCAQITYDPVDIGDGYKIERWTCAVQGGCGREFVPKALAEKAERALAALLARWAALHELIHEQSGLDDHRYSPEQMVKEMAERWQGASDDCEKAERERDEARASARRADHRLSVVAEERDTLRARVAKLEAVVDAARTDVQSADALLLAFEHGAGGTLSERVEQVTRKSRASLRALDEDKTPGSSSGLPDAADAPQATAQPEQRNESPQDALGNGGARGTFSGGSGAATSTGTSPAPEAGSTPEPAGSSHDPLAALEAAVGRPLTADDRDRIQGVVERLRPDAPRGGLLPEPCERGPRPDYATRREVEELRRRVEKLEAERAR